MFSILEIKIGTCPAFQSDDGEPNNKGNFWVVFDDFILNRD